METGPQRPEDYEALAERARRAEAELAKVKARPERRKAFWAGAKHALKRVAICLAIIGGAVAFGTTMNHVFKPDPHARHTPCWFTRQDADQDGHRMPWYHWSVYQSDCSDCSNYPASIGGHPIDFATQDEAWKFIQAWHLKACK